MSPTSPITTHVLDTSAGRPASGVEVELARESGSAFSAVQRSVTNADGRVTDLLTPGALTPGIYRLRFFTRAYFAQRGQVSFYPHVDVVFSIEPDATDAHYHVPLLLNPYGYSTYRGS